MLGTKAPIPFLVTLLLIASSQGCSVDPEDKPPSDKASSRRSTTDVLFSLTGLQADYELGIQALQKANVGEDVRVAIRAEDRRLIGLHGYALEIPGVEGPVPTGYSVIAIKGTGDFIANEAQDRFQGLLRSYAGAYNKGVLRDHKK